MLARSKWRHETSQFPSHPLIKRGHQRRLVCWRQTQSVLIAIRRRRKTFIHLIWNVQTLVETWDAFSIAARAWEHMERRKLSDPPHLACVRVVFALTPILNCFSKRAGFSGCFYLFSLGLKDKKKIKFVCVCVSVSEDSIILFFSFSS